MNKTIRNYKYRLYPTDDQSKIIDEYIDSLRGLWNMCVAHAIDNYKNYGVFIPENEDWISREETPDVKRYLITKSKQRYYSEFARLNSGRHAKEEYLKDVKAVMAQEVGDKLQLALKAFFGKGKAGYAVFKKLEKDAELSIDEKVKTLTKTKGFLKEKGLYTKDDILGYFDLHFDN